MQSDQCCACEIWFSKNKAAAQNASAKASASFIYPSAKISEVYLHFPFSMLNLTRLTQVYSNMSILPTERTLNST